MQHQHAGAEPEAAFLDMIATGELATVDLDREDYGRSAERARGR